MRHGWLLLVALAASGCGKPSAGTSQSVDLEQAAIRRGLIHDPSEKEIAGVFARDSDRLCLVPVAKGHRVGIVIDYGEGIACSARGTATPGGETLDLRLGDGEDCRLTARFDGDRLALPGAVPAGCKRFCTGRASLAGAQFLRVSNSAAEARAMRDARGRRLCGD